MTILNKIANGVSIIPGVGGLINRVATNRACNSTTPRPRAFSLWSHVEKPKKPLDAQGPVSNYTSWPMLTNKEYSTRHLPPASDSYVNNLPEDTAPSTDGFGDITNLFKRDGKMKTDRSSVLFMFFAQWFTDSVLRVHPIDRRKNTSNHNIDLCQIYGLTEETAKILRDHHGGRLTSQKVNGEEFPDYLGEIIEGDWKVKDKYKELPYATTEVLNKVFANWSSARKEKAYASGLERGNSSIGYITISTIFLREHNRIAAKLAGQNPTWDDERLFQTARMINTVILLKLVVEDYISHISGFDVIKFDRSFAEKQQWYRTPWISIEFDILYRWHGLIPETIKVDGKDIPHTDYRSRNDLLENLGVSALVDAVSTQKAGKIDLFNSPDFILPAEYYMIKMGRDFKLQPYNAYRKRFGLKRCNSFDDLTNDEKLKNVLKKLYKDDIDKVEYVIGLFAQKHGSNDLYGDLMGKMVAYDAFTQIYTNPLLSSNVYNAQTYTEYGLNLINETNSVRDLVGRNVNGKSKAKFSA
jgi:prostaglandin-endoperoxide synthase 2